ncbi:hypothetical protein RF11_11476 [Thelohanellus kitauei]|uniref:Tc1-like transposase DDE domain-containing protein n=1 Tax=Thelohanellus kitauei TaxID=669202 RepID=A0A0C2J1H3_THEKT|nr:hypothetical protein RF11_11476 [Thelohanellus kitauei]
MEKRLKGGNNRAKLADEQKELLWDIRICNLFFERHQIRIGRSTDARCFKLLLYIKNPPVNSRKAQDGICHELSENSSDRQIFFFIDETGFLVNMICLYGRELTGIRATRIVLAWRYRKYYVACTISCELMVNFKINERAYNAECFLEYLLEIFEIFRAREISETYLVMDNVPFHKTEFFQNTMRSFNHIPIYLPPHSPFLNHIENLLSKW